MSLRTFQSFSLICSLALAVVDGAPAQEPSTSDPAQRLNLPEAPETVVEGRQSSVGSQGTAASGSTELVTPNLEPTALANTASSVTVITAEQIAQRGGQNLVSEILRGTAGLDVVRTGNPGSQTSVFLRGAGSQHTKVLIDGIPANDPSAPNRAFDFGNLSVDNIERVEIIRGPQSVLYGSDAIGGVINIITKKGSGPMTGRVGAQGGAYGTANTAGNLSGSRGSVYYSTGGSYYRTTGFSAAASGTEPDGFLLGTFSSRVGWQPSENVNLDFVVRYNQGNTHIDNGFTTPPSDDIEDFTAIKQLSTGVRLHTKDDSGIYEQLTAFYATNIDRSYNALDNVLPFNNFQQWLHGMTQQVNSMHTLHLLDLTRVGFDVTAGGSYYTETMQSSDNFGDFFPTTSQDDGAAYGQAVLRLGEGWYTTAGVRTDHYNLYGVHDTYRTTSIYRFAGTKTAIRGTLGTGFRAPSIEDRFNPFTGNPNIQPEFSKGWDFGIEQPLFDGDVVTSVTYFRNDFFNLIQANPVFGFQSQNIASARATGIEFNTLFVLSPTASVTTSYTYTDTADLSVGTTSYGQPLIRRPRNKWGIVYNQRFFNRLNWNVSLNYVGNRYDLPPSAVRVLLPNYCLLNTGVVFDVSRRLQLIGRIDNVCNANYQELYGYGVASASGYAGANLMW